MEVCPYSVMWIRSMDVSFYNRRVHGGGHKNCFKDKCIIKLQHPDISGMAILSKVFKGSSPNFVSNIN